MLPRENKGQLFFHSSLKVTHFPNVGFHCRSLLCHICLLSKTVGSFHLSKGHAPNSLISKHQIPSLLKFLPISCYHMPSFNPHDKPFLLTGSLFPFLSLPCHPPPTSLVTYLFCDRVLLLPLVVSSFSHTIEFITEFYFFFLKGKAAMLTDPRETLSCCLFQVTFTVLRHFLFWKHLPHSAHIKGFSPVWTCWCLLA